MSDELRVQVMLLKLQDWSYGNNQDQQKAEKAAWASVKLSLAFVG